MADVNSKFEILRFLAEHGPASGKGVGAAVGKPRSTISDHLRQLDAEGFVQCVEERPIRGAVERFYVATSASRWVEDAELAEMNPNERQQLKFRVLRSAIQDASLAFSAAKEGFREGECFSSARAHVDCEGWRELSDIHRRAVEEMQKVREASLTRISQNPAAAAITVTSGVFLFELPL